MKDAGKNAPKFTAEDLKIIASPLDFVGINVYKPDRYVLASDTAPGWRDIPYAKGHPMLSSRWHTMGPEALYWAPKFVQSLWDAREIHITENGCATQDVIAADGNIYDTDRIMFLRACLTQLQRAAADGVPVKGYFQWSAMDNFEWTAGFGNRYGLVYVDFGTQKRTPKLSASFFRETARQTPLPRSVNIRFLVPYRTAPNLSAVRFRGEADIEAKGLLLLSTQSGRLRAPECSVGPRSNTILQPNIK